MKSLNVFSGLKVHIDPKVFMSVFDGWVKHHSIEIRYLDPQNGNGPGETVVPELTALKSFFQ